jgi:hypothetical protein
MATTVGIYISLDNETDTGLRPVGWCSETSHAPYWTNQSIQFAGTLDSTEAQVGDDVTVQVKVRGAEATVDGKPISAPDTYNQVLGIQAWVCYPTSSSELIIVPSMSPSGGGTPPTFTSSAEFLSGDYPNAQSTMVARWFSLAPKWKPQAGDLVAPNTVTHACIVANCWGTANVGSILLNAPTESVGQEITGSIAHSLSLINVCAGAPSDQSQPLYRQGQRNIHIVPVPARHSGRTGALGFLAGAPTAAEPRRIVVRAVTVQQGDVVDPTVRGALDSGKYHSLPLQPATTPPKAVVVRTNSYKQEAHLATIVREAERVTPDGNGLQLLLPPKGLQPLLLEVELDPAEASGSVHVLDIVQTDTATGGTSGSRVAVVAVP